MLLVLWQIRASSSITFFNFFFNNCTRPRSKCSMRREGSHPHGSTLCLGLHRDGLGIWLGDTAWMLQETDREHFVHPASQRSLGKPCKGQIPSASLLLLLFVLLNGSIEPSTSMSIGFLSSTFSSLFLPLIFKGQGPVADFSGLLNKAMSWENWHLPSSLRKAPLFFWGVSLDQPLLILVTNSYNPSLFNVSTTKWPVKSLICKLQWNRFTPNSPCRKNWPEGLPVKMSRGRTNQMLRHPRI